MSIVFLLVVSLFLFCAGAQVTTTTHRAYDFHHSVGVNIHLHYQGFCYDQWNIFKPLLLESKILHYRDALVNSSAWTPFYTRHNELGAAGLKGSFTNSLSNDAYLIKHFPDIVTNMECYENINEPNLNGGSWVNNTLNSAKFLWDNRNPNYCVVGPSITKYSDALLVGDLSAYINHGNAHNYFAGYNPGNGLLQGGLNTAKVTGPQASVWVTETGYGSPISGQLSVQAHDLPFDIHAKYIVRDLLLSYLKGATRTTIYQFCDQGSDGYYDYGIVGVNAKNTSDMTPKPAFYLIRDFLTLVEDSAANAGTFTPVNISLAIGGNVTNLNTLVLEQANGVYYLVLWVEVYGYNGTATTPRITIVPQTVVVNVTSPFVGLYYTFNSDTGKINAASTTTISQTGRSTSLVVSDGISILKLSPSSNTVSSTSTSSASSASTIVSSANSGSTSASPAASSSTSASSTQTSASSTSSASSAHASTTAASSSTTSSSPSSAGSTSSASSASSASSTTSGTNSGSPSPAPITNLGITVLPSLGITLCALLFLVY